MSFGFAATSRTAKDSARRSNVQEMPWAHVNKRVAVLVRDTQLDPELALQQLHRLIHRQHVIAVIGPQSSAEVGRLKDLADRERVSLLSQGSTASSLYGGLTHGGRNFDNEPPTEAIFLWRFVAGACGEVRHGGIQATKKA